MKGQGRPLTHRLTGSLPTLPPPFFFPFRVGLSWKDREREGLSSVPEETRLGQLGANISPDRSSLTPQVLIGNFLKHNYPLLYELQHINLLCLYLPKEDGVSPDAEYIPQIIFSIFLQ